MNLCEESSKAIESTHLYMLTLVCLMNSAVVPCLVVLLLARDLLRPRDITIAQELKSVSDKGTFTDSLSDSAMLGGAAARARQPHMQISEDMVWKQRYMDLRQQFDKSKQKSVHWHNASAPSVFPTRRRASDPSVFDVAEDGMPRNSKVVAVILQISAQLEELSNL